MIDEERLDILISRVVDGEASEEDFHELEGALRTDSDAWSALVDSIRDGAAVSRLVGAATAAADRVELPGGRSADAPAPFVLMSLARWAGWGVAAALALAWVLSVGTRGNGPLGPGTGTGGAEAPVTGRMVEYTSPQHALNEYMRMGGQEGKVIGEWPEKILIRTRPVPGGGGYDVLFLRPLLERDTVPDLYRFGGQGESGGSKLIPFEQPRSGEM